MFDLPVYVQALDLLVISAYQQAKVMIHFWKTHAIN